MWRLWLTCRCHLVLKAIDRLRLVPRQRLGCRTPAIALVCRVLAIMFCRLHAWLHAMNLHVWPHAWLHAMNRILQGQAPTMNRICLTTSRIWPTTSRICPTTSRICPTTSRIWQGQVLFMRICVGMPTPPQSICQHSFCRGQIIHIHFLIPNATLPFKLPKPPCGWAPVPQPCMLPDAITCRVRHTSLKLLRKIH